MSSDPRSIRSLAQKINHRNMITARGCGKCGEPLSEVSAGLANARQVKPSRWCALRPSLVEQMQADFTHVRRGRSPLLAFVATLGYNRASYVQFTVGEDTQTLCTCLREALMFFGGVPAHVLVENPKTVVIERDFCGEGQHRYNRDLLALAEEFGFRPRLCRPYRGQDQGQSRAFQWISEGQLLVPLAATLKQSGLTLDHIAANAHIGPWLQAVADARIHGTTRRSRMSVFSSSASTCIPHWRRWLPARPFVCHALPVCRRSLRVCGIRCRSTNHCWRWPDEPSHRAHRATL